MGTVQKEANPFKALVELEGLSNQSAFALYNEVERLKPSYREEETQELFLFYHFINILAKANVDCLLAGGILMKMFFKEHARHSSDIDVIAKDPEILFKQIEKAIAHTEGDISFQIKWTKRKWASPVYFYDTFGFEVEAYHDGDLFKTFLLDGKAVEYYDQIEKAKYIGPKIIAPDFYFYGVRIEYVACEKIMAISCELLRPIKHLVDVYTLRFVDLDYSLLKKYLRRCLEKENKVRDSLGMPRQEERYGITKGKLFIGNFYLCSISAGYRLTKKEMVKAVNDWCEEKLGEWPKLSRIPIQNK